MNYSYHIHQQQRSALNEFLSGPRYACLVSGPAGVGKTLLTRTVIDDDKHHSLYLKFGQFDRSGCLSTEIIQLLDLPTREESESNSAYGQQEIDAFCANALKKFDSDQVDPCLLIVDDVQWMSYRDLGTLDKVFSAPEYSNLKVIFILRTENKYESFQTQLVYKLKSCFHNLSVVDLEPLSTSECLTLLDASKEDSANSFGNQEIIQASNGLPALLRFFTSIKGR